MGFVCHFFDVGAVQDPIKQTPVTAAVPRHIFNMLLQKILQKMTPKGVSFSHACTSFWKEFEASLSFYTLFDKVMQKASKRHQQMTLFLDFLSEMYRKEFKNDD